MTVDMLRLKVASSQEWVQTVLNDFDTFLKDHADCERKASSMAMSFVAKYPDRTEISQSLFTPALRNWSTLDWCIKLWRNAVSP